MTLVEVFADITCPFTHVGLRQVVRELDSSTDIVVRAWPLEWVNGAPLDAIAVQVKIHALRSQLDLDAFRGIVPEHWPRTTVPALNLVAAAYAEGPAVGLDVSLAVRDALFERGQDISNPAVLAELAAEMGLSAPGLSPSQQVHDDYAEGRRREVTGSPDFWVGGEEFFCPSLDLDHDGVGDLRASFDTNGLARFITRVRELEASQGDQHEIEPFRRARQRLDHREPGRRGSQRCSHLEGVPAGCVAAPSDVPGSERLRTRHAGR